MEALLDFETKSIEELDFCINEEGFKWVCENGYLEIAKWLLTIKPDIDISADNKYAFTSVCENGHLEVAKWLLSIKPDIDISDDNENLN